MLDFSVVSVNWNSYEFARMLIESINSFTQANYEVIIVDNSIYKQNLNYKNVTVLPQKENVGHGQGLNIGIEHASAPYTFVFDIDCHILKRGWDTAFLQALEGYDVLGGRGVPEKPIRAACMLFDTTIGLNYDFRDTPGYKGHRVTPEGFDVAIQAYHKMLADGLNIKLIDSVENRYGTLNGEEWCIDGVPYIYHHWHGSHLKERQVDFDEDLQEDRDHLFRNCPWRMPPI